FEKVGNDPSARYAQQLEQHRRPHPSAVAAGRAVEEQGVNIALGEDFKKGAPVVAELVNDRVMLAAGDQAYRLALLEPAVADRDMLPPNRAQKVGVRRPKDRDLGGALQGDERAQARGFDRGFVRQFGKMRRAIDPRAPHAAAVGGRMAAEIAEIAAAEAAQQVEIDDD